MLKFAEYRKRIYEEVEPSSLPNGFSIHAPMKPITSPTVPTTKPSPVLPELERMIDVFVSLLKKQIVRSPDANRGVWDRMKNWWSNIYHGSRSTRANPYYWQNKLGDTMGKTTETTDGDFLIPLDHYMILHECALQLEDALPPGIEKLQIMKVIDSWASQFKRSVINLVQRHNEPVSMPSPPEVTPGIDPDKANKPATEITPGIDPDKANKPATEVIPTDPFVDKRRQIKTELEATKNILSPKVYDLLNHDIEKGDEHRLDVVKMFLDKRTATLDPDKMGKPPVAEAPKTTLPAEEENNDVSPPEVDSRQWSKLTPHEKAQWDEVGGGNAGDASLYARHHHEIKTLPWILRIGDPRLAAIESIPKGSLYRRLVRQKRIESPKRLITTSIQLEKAVEEAKAEAAKEFAETSAKRKTTHQNIKTKKTIKQPEPTTELEGETGGIKPPRTNRIETIPGGIPGGTNIDEPITHIPDPEELRNSLESLKDITDEKVYAHIKKWIEEGSPRLLRKAAEKINNLKQEDAHRKNVEIEPDAPAAKSGGNLNPVENTIPEITKMTITNFRKKARR